jgi:SAM-dependent methyltransferase
MLNMYRYIPACLYANGDRAMNTVTLETGSAPRAAPKQLMGKMDRAAKFWDRVAERYAKRPVADEAAYRKKLDVTRGYLRPDMDVLELGCGTGSTAIVHAPHVKHIRAVDISSGMLAIANRKAKAAHIDNIKFEQSTIDDLDVADGSMDAVLALSLLHLLEDRDVAITRVHKMLKPGGVFVTSTACLGETMGWFRYVGPVGKFLGLFPLVRIFTPDDLEQSFIRAGFEIEYNWQPGKGKAVFIIAKKNEVLSG